MYQTTPKLSDLKQFIIIPHGSVGWLGLIEKFLVGISQVMAVKWCWWSESPDYPMSKTAPLILLAVDAGCWLGARLRMPSEAPARGHVNWAFNSMASGFQEGAFQSPVEAADFLWSRLEVIKHHFYWLLLVTQGQPWFRARRDYKRTECRTCGSREGGGAPLNTSYQPSPWTIP